MDVKMSKALGVDARHQPDSRSRGYRKQTVRTANREPKWPARSIVEDVIREGGRRIGLLSIKFAVGHADRRGEAGYHNLR